MHEEILTDNQKELLGLIKEFSRDYYLVGGTALALHIGHRQSIDFDLFSGKAIKRKSLKNILAIKGLDFTVIHEAVDQLHVIVNHVKITFFEYPYAIKTSKRFRDVIPLPDILTLSAMKAFALGGRAKWKDYVDMYYILKHYFPLEDVIRKSRKIYGNGFNSKLFRQQLSYFDDIDYSEKVVYLLNSPDESEIKSFLVDAATSEFSGK